MAAWLPSLKNKFKIMITIAIIMIFFTVAALGTPLSRFLEGALYTFYE